MTDEDQIKNMDTSLPSALHEDIRHLIGTSLNRILKLDIVLRDHF